MPIVRYCIINSFGDCLDVIDWDNAFTYYPASGRLIAGDNTGQKGWNYNNGALPGGTWTFTTSSSLTPGDDPGVSGLPLRPPQYLNSGTSYTTPANCTRIMIEVIGGGGAGGAGADDGSGSGGGGGGYAASLLTVIPNTGYTYAIGAGGVPTVSGTAGAGSASTITIGGVTITANGGGGGVADSTTVGAGGTATGGDINITGTAGTAGSGNQQGAFGFGGGNAKHPVGSRRFNTDGLQSVMGTSALNPGCGGGGGQTTGTGDFPGGYGAQGQIIIWEYA
jgi:hypothetical protein